MDLDSALMLTSFVGLAMGPFWANWTAALLSRWMQPGSMRAVCIILLTLAVMLFWHAGPWALMMGLHGQLGRNLADPSLLLVLCIFFGPGILLQVANSLLFVRRADKLSYCAGRTAVSGSAKALSVQSLMSRISSSSSLRSTAARRFRGRRRKWII
jgi:hypothetical protein